MGGKALLILIMAFTITFTINTRNFTRMATDTTQNFSSYYYTLKCRAAAAVGINILNNRLFFRAGAVDTVFTFNFDGVTVLDSLKTIDPYLNIKKIVSTATISLPHAAFAPKEEWFFKERIKVIVKPSMFSKYAYFSHNEGSNIFWAGRDSIFGPFHTNGNLQFSGNSVFTGLVTHGGTISLNGYNPRFLAGRQGNTNIQIPTTGVDTVQSYAAGGVQISGQSTVYLDFRGDSIRFRYNTTSAWNSRLLSSWTPNGVISIVNAQVFVKGTIKGRYSIGVSGSATGLTGAGNVWLEDDIIYHTNPRTNPNSTDMLGIIAEKNIVIQDNTANRNNIIIEASLFAQEGSFTVQNFNSGSPRGTIWLYGGIIQHTRGAVGTGSGNTLSTGYWKNYKYDTRLQTSYPPHFPGCGTFEIVTWFE